MKRSGTNSESRLRLARLALQVLAGTTVLLGATACLAAEGLPLGPPFTANTNLNGDQGDDGNIRTVALGDGGFVIVWSDSLPNPDRVAGQRFDARGFSIGTEFAMGGTQDAGLSAIAAAGLADDGFVVAWNDDNSSGGTGYDVSAQLFDSAGAPVGSVFPVNTTTALNQGDRIDVEGLDDGTFFVVWTDKSSLNTDVVGQHFSSTGTSLGTEFIVNTEVTGDQGEEAIDMAKLDGGGFVVVWSDYGAPGDNGFDVAAQRFDAAGAKVGSEFVANETTANHQGSNNAAVVGLAGGGFAVAWDTDSIPALGFDVVARRFDSNGMPIGSEFSVNTDRFDNQGALALGASSLPGGDFVIAWTESYSIFGLYPDVSAQRFDGTGAKVGQQLVVNSVSGQGRNNIGIGALKDGGFVVSWDGYQEYSGYDVIARVFDGPGCAAQPADGCTRTTKTLIKIKQDLDPTKRQLLWKWLLGTIDLPDLGDPAGGSTGYALCLYDDIVPVAALHVPAAGTCGNKSCWKATATGFKYSNAVTNRDGVFKLQFKAGAGNAKVLLKARGTNLIPPLPITQSDALRVQLVRTDGSECWESIFAPPATKTDATNFKDKEDTQPQCSNFTKEAGEECEVGNLGATCTTLGFDGGSLACNPSTCRLDTSGCIVGHKTVFITSLTTTGNLSGLSGADAVCNAHAYDAGLSGTYKAWLADDAGSPSTTFVQSTSPYKLVDGTLIANDWADLTDGTIQNPIALDENGNTVAAPLFVWSDVTVGGATNNPAFDCVDWTSSSGSDGGRRGLRSAVNSTWTDVVPSGCNLALRLYCFEQ